MIKINRIITTQTTNVLNKQNKQTVRPFEQDCKTLFTSFLKNKDISQNQHNFGNFIRRHNNEVNDSELITIKKYIRSYLQKTKKFGSKQPIHLVNMLYHTLIKVITPEQILSGQIKPESYRKLIDDSISMYSRHMLKDGIDYRHMLGRFQTLKKMSYIIGDHFTKLPAYFKPLEWRSQEQLDYVGVLEKINKHFNAINANFALSNVNNEEKGAFSKEIAASELSSAIIKAICLLYSDTQKLLSSPRKNYDEIKSNIELAEHYIDKIPMNGNHCSFAMKYLNKFIQIEKDLHNYLKTH